MKMRRSRDMMEMIEQNKMYIIEIIRNCQKLKFELRKKKTQSIWKKLGTDWK